MSNVNGSLIASNMVSIVPQNGTEFDVNSGQKVIFELDPSVGLVKGRDSYLVFDVLNNSSDYKRLGLNNTAGVDGLISRVDIYSLRTGKHLETMENYNQFMSIANQYFFEDKTNLQNLQGCGEKVYSQHDILGTTVSVEGNVVNVEDAILSPIANQGGANNGKPVYNFRRFVTPLKSGIFRYWDDERLCPVMAFQGLRIELTLENPKICSRLLNGRATNGTDIDLVDTLSANAGLNVQDNQAGLNLLGQDGIVVADTGLAIGNEVAIHYKDNLGADQIHNSTIAGMQQQGGDPTKVQYTLGDALPAGNKTVTKIFFRNDTRALKVRPQFRIMRVAPTDEVIREMSKGINYSFTSYDYFVDSLLSNVRKHLIELNSVATKAVCVMTTFSDTTQLEEQLFSSYFCGDDANELSMNSIQYFLNGRLAPVRSYNPKIQNEKIIALNELNKALTTLNLEPKDLGNTDGKNIEIYTNVFTVARQLARRGYYYNLRDAEGQIRLGFDANRTNNMQTNTFVWSIKIASVDANGEINIIQ
jgi:hypothetical protein